MSPFSEQISVRGGEREMCTSLNKYLYVFLVFLGILFFKQKLDFFL